MRYEKQTELVGGRLLFNVGEVNSSNFTMNAASSDKKSITVKSQTTNYNIVLKFKLVI